MLNIHEFRVRPVNRFVLTEYRREGGPNAPGGTPRTIAELPNAELADALGEALQRAHPGSSLTKSDGDHSPATGLEFVIVEAHTFVPGALVYYAYNEQEAVITQTNAQMMHGREFKVFRRPRSLEQPPPPAYAAPMPTLAEQEKPHTQYPARFALDEQVLRASSIQAMTGVGQSGIAESFPAEPAVIVGIHFYGHKVCYDVTYPSGRRGETVDSTELSEQPPTGATGGTTN